MPSLGLGSGLTSQSFPSATPFNNYSLAFDGVDDYVDLGSNVDAGIESAISFWYYHLTDDEDYRYILASYTGGDFGFYRRQGQNKFDIHIGGYGQGAYIDATLSNATWYHIVLNRTTAENVELYIDGTDIGDLGNEAWDSTNTVVGLIGRRQAGGLYAQGKIDELAIWNEKLDAPAITSIYNSGTPTDLTKNTGDYDEWTDNLIGYWRMEEGSGVDVINTANVGTNDGTVNSATWDTSVPPN